LCFMSLVNLFTESKPKRSFCQHRYSAKDFRVERMTA